MTVPGICCHLLRHYYFCLWFLLPYQIGIWHLYQNLDVQGYSHTANKQAGIINTSYLKK